jgi:hypothetical protein
MAQYLGWRGASVLNSDDPMPHYLARKTDPDEIGTRSAKHPHGLLKLPSLFDESTGHASNDSDCPVERRYRARHRASGSASCHELSGSGTADRSASGHNNGERGAYVLIP